MAIVLSSAALTELAYARLDLERERKGTSHCEKHVGALRKSLEKFPGKIAALTPEAIEIAEARRHVLGALSERCHACGRCPMADE